jgi:hypothetical protein
VASTPSAVADLVSEFSTCLFHVIPRVPGGATGEKTGPVVPYRRIKPVLLVSISFEPECNYWVASFDIL